MEASGPAARVSSTTPIRPRTIRRAPGGQSEWAGGDGDPNGGVFEMDEEQRRRLERAVTAGTWSR
jgi:hypothetical protein